MIKVIKSLKIFVEGELHLKLFLVLLIVVGIVLCLIFVLFTEINFKLLRNYVGQTVDFW